MVIGLQNPILRQKQAHKIMRIQYFDNNRNSETIIINSTTRADCESIYSKISRFLFRTGQMRAQRQTQKLSIIQLMGKARYWQGGPQGLSPLR